nr:immunoglobulin light chain junction region [Macaca mulatta]
CMQGLEFPSTF